MMRVKAVRYPHSRERQFLFYLAINIQIQPYQLGQVRSIANKVVCTHSLRWRCACGTIHANTDNYDRLR